MDIELEPTQDPQTAPAEGSAPVLCRRGGVPRGSEGRATGGSRSRWTEGDEALEVELAQAMEALGGAEAIAAAFAEAADHADDPELDGGAADAADLAAAEEIAWAPLLAGRRSKRLISCQ
jgi:hypothetical protein